MLLGVVVQIRQLKRVAFVNAESKHDTLPSLVKHPCQNQYTPIIKEVGGQLVTPNVTPKSSSTVRLPVIVTSLLKPYLKGPTLS